MTIEYEDRGKGRQDAVMTECPACGGDLESGEGFADHWPNCSVNPANTEDDSS